MTYFVTIANLETGEILSRLGPYAAASVARVAAGVAAGQALIWHREGQDWIAEFNGHVYRVPVDEAGEA